MIQRTQIKPEALNVASQMILMEVDLTGTDDQRKAAIAAFETKWKALTGSDDLQGVRFVGKLYDFTKYIFLFDGNSNGYKGLSLLAEDDDKIRRAYIDRGDGSVEITSLFDHLKAVNLYSSEEENINALTAYEEQLSALGLNPDIGEQQGCIIPVFIHLTEEELPYFGYVSNCSAGMYVGYVGFGDKGFCTIQITSGNVSITPLATKEDIDNTNKLANAVKSLGAIELNMSTASNATNKTTLTTYKKILTDAGVTISKGYSASIRLVNGSNEYFGTLNIGTGTLLGGIVTDINESKHYPINVNTSTGEVTFSADNYFLEKTSNEVQEMLDAIKYSQTHVPFTDTTLSNKAQLEVFLSKVPTAEVMHCTYNDIYAGTLHKINGDWYGQLVKNTNNYEDAICIKVQADGTLIKGTTSLQSVSEQLDEIIG